jgi:hypothetical protein
MTCVVAEGTDRVTGSAAQGVPGQVEEGAAYDAACEILTEIAGMRRRGLTTSARGQNLIAIFAGSTSGMQSCRSRAGSWTSSTPRITPPSM